jgi:hypothetical protein
LTAAERRDGVHARLRSRLLRLASSASLRVSSAVCVGATKKKQIGCSRIPAMPSWPCTWNLATEAEQKARAALQLVSSSCR